MIITGKSLARRTFLRGVGTAVALPLLDSMVPALGTAAKGQPVRMGFVYVPNGIIQSSWLPAKEGKGFEFNSTMKPIEGFREHINVISGLAQANGRALGDGGGDHGRAGASWLTGVHPKKTEGNDIHAGISADQIAAKELGKFTQFGSIEIGLESPQVAGGCDSGYSCAYTNTISWRSPTTPNPMEVNPRAVFERLFGDGDTTDAATRMKQVRLQASILDYVTGDLARLKSSVGARDRSKLDEYTDGVRDIERRIQIAEAQSADALIPSMQRPAGAPEDFEAHAKLMTDMMVVAFQADLSRIFTFMYAREGSKRNYQNLGVNDGHHFVTHHANDPGKITSTIKINEFHVQNFAYMLERFRSTPDGDGSLLDHSMLLYGSSLNDGNAHTHDDLPLVLAGGANGQIKGGQHIRYHQETPMTNLLVSMLLKAGVPCEKIGDSTGKLEELQGV